MNSRVVTERICGPLPLMASSSGTCPPPARPQASSRSPLAIAARSAAVAGSSASPGRSSASSAARKQASTGVEDSPALVSVASHVRDTTSRMAIQARRARAQRVKSQAQTESGFHSSQRPRAARDRLARRRALDDQALLTWHAARRRPGHVDQAEPGAAAGERAVRPADPAPVSGHGNDRLALPPQQAVQRVPARRPVLQLPGGATVLPACCPPVVQAGQRTRPPRGPAAPGDGMTGQLQQAGLDVAVHAGRDRASRQSQPGLPWCRCSATACPVTAARSRPVSSRAAASSAASGDKPGLPGTDPGSASRAPRLATRQTCTTAGRSTFHSAAASRRVARPVSTDTEISYFSAGAGMAHNLRLLASISCTEPGPRMPAAAACPAAC
jgi:hypothetical protein